MKEHQSKTGQSWKFEQKQSSIKTRNRLTQSKPSSPYFPRPPNRNQNMEREGFVFKLKYNHTSNQEKSIEHSQSDHIRLGGKPIKSPRVSHEGARVLPLLSFI